jgi:peptide/nickel transport system permease protein
MGRYALTRILWLIPTLLCMIIFLFSLIHFAPGDPVDVMCGPRSSEETKTMVRELFHLDKPIHVQVFYFIKNLSQGNLGVSIADREPVIDKVVRVLPNTVVLTFFAMSWTFVLALILGSLSGIYQNTWIDYLITGFSFTVISIPAFVIGLLLLLIFSIKIPILPMSGSGAAGNLWSQIYHLILPATAISLGWLGFMCRTVKAMMIEVLTKDYVKMERSFGVPSLYIWGKYALRNAAMPVVTQLGFATGEFLGGAVFIEMIFRRPGMGRLLADSVLSLDYPVLQGAVFLTTIMFVFANLLADLSHGFIDPRVRLRR